MPGLITCPTLRHRPRSQNNLAQADGHFAAWQAATPATWASRDNSCFSPSTPYGVELVQITKLAYTPPLTDASLTTSIYPRPRAAAAAIAQMRLLNTTTLTLESFPARAPPYAILSHTWMAEEGAEPTLQDVVAGTHAGKPGWAKVETFCRLVLARRGLSHAWVDTVCIDKTSSAELSEAINAMFRWYRRAACCFAYLADVPDDDGAPCFAAAPGLKDDAHDDGTPSHHSWVQLQQQQQEEGGNEPGPAFERSRWFTRGWTLQELLAPRSVTFFSRSWRTLGTRRGLAERIARRTRIPVPVLLTGSWAGPPASASAANAAARMSWAAGRATARPEDQAYCLLGLFGIHMPLLYGEGGPRAFVRLQEEVLRQRGEDCSLLVWDASVLDDADFDDDDDDYGGDDDYSGGGGGGGCGDDGGHGGHDAQRAGGRRRLVVGALAPKADCFANAGDVVCHPAPASGPDSVITSTSRGLIVRLCVMTREDGPPGERLGVLPCHVRGDMATAVAIELVPLPLDVDGGGGGGGGSSSMAVSTAATHTYARARAAPVVLPMVLPALASQPVLLPTRCSGRASVTAGGGNTWPGGSVEQQGETTWWLKYFSGNCCDLLGSWSAATPSSSSVPSSSSSPSWRSSSSSPWQGQASPSWTRNDPTKTMTLLIPQTTVTRSGQILPARGPVSSVAAFRVRGRDDFFAVCMELGPGNGKARVELSALDGAPSPDDDLLRLVRGGGTGLTMLELPSATVSVRFGLDDVRGTLTNAITVVCMRPLGRG